MDTTISIKTIEATDAFKNLSKVQQSFCLKRANRLILTNALIVHRNTGIIPSNISGYNLFVLQEIILGEFMKSQEPDYEKIVKDFMRKHTKEQWMSESDFEEFLNELQSISGITIESMANDLKQGVKNGHSVDFQLNILEKILKPK
jgi:hypothetical protein